MIEKRISIFRTIQSDPGVAAPPPPFFQKEAKSIKTILISFYKDGRMDGHSD